MNYLKVIKYLNLDIRLLSVILFMLTSSLLFSQVKLPKLVSDDMVLQRDMEVKIWGWASASEDIIVHFIDRKFTTKADDSGDWEIVLPPMEYGGPYQMKIVAKNEININNILIGDVWVCSGQSNMGVSLGMVREIYEDEIKEMNNPYIRHFFTFPSPNFKNAEKDFRFGQWQVADSNSLRSLTAVGYFFAQEIYEKYKIPIGLINSSMGGSSAEAWISEEAIKSFPIYYDQLQKFKDDNYLEKITRQDDERVQSWNEYSNENDEGLKNPRQTWFSPEFDDYEWETTDVPGYWTITTNLGNVNGVVWFRKIVNVSSTMVGKEGIIKLGRIVNSDSVYINGKFIGSVGSQYAPRNYKIPAGILKEGSNTIVIRIVNYIRKGGFVPGKDYEMIVGKNNINLEGEWKYNVGVITEQLDDKMFTGKIPSGLFNAGISPILNYSIKGVLWYQGESNTSRPFEHYDLFKLLIQDWRKNWDQGDFPFLYVQLPNFIEVNVERTKYDWAYFRESQLKALIIPNTGMSVTIDVGEYNDIHPKKKKPIGQRLALVAEHVAYGEAEIVYSGPLYESMQVEGNKLVLSFTNIGSGMKSQDDKELKCFETCGSDNLFLPAKAIIRNNQIIIWNENVINPVAVRYAWDNNPEGANLYNIEGLPASPFRTSELY
ncbi:MAG: sialate O-acetylesterase [Melioribacteraceae bacterium]|nr:sialate O-acetylesterase [Melioribacteraceae bacterium]